MDFTWTISGATILVFLGWVGTLGVFLYRRGGAETTIVARVDSAHAKIDAVEASRQRWRDDIERSLEQRFAGVIGQVNLHRDQLSEVKENIALNYMTRPEIAAIEHRVTEGQGRIIDRLEKFDGRLQQMQTSIIEAIRRPSP